MGAINRLTEARYLGKVCDLHPTFNGLRYTISRACVACKGSYTPKAIPKPVIDDLNVHAFNKNICRKHPELFGLRDEKHPKVCAGCESLRQILLFARKSDVAYRKICELEHSKRLVLPGFHTGMVCPKHPEAEGLRQNHGNTCIACMTEFRAARQAKKADKALKSKEAATLRHRTAMAAKAALRAEKRANPGGMTDKDLKAQALRKSDKLSRLRFEYNHQQAENADARACIKTLSEPGTKLQASIRHGYEKKLSKGLQNAARIEQEIADIQKC